MKTENKKIYQQLNLYTRFEEEKKPEIKISWYETAPELDRDTILKRAEENSYTLKKWISSLRQTEKTWKWRKKSLFPISASQ